ncbi:MAG: hypothetical protein KBD01_12060 [Acidobacteria bacterium]|nr:hypothetical protein [Acidobacteriota bacterium]
MGTLPPCCCCCCGGYIAAGAIAGAMYAFAGNRLGCLARSGEGALAGAFAGAIASVLQHSLWALWFAFSPLRGDWHMDAWTRDPKVSRAMEQVSRWINFERPLQFAAVLVSSLVVGMAIGALAGLLATLLFRREPLVSPVAPPPPPPSPPLNPPNV